MHFLHQLQQVQRALNPSNGILSQSHSAACMSAPNPWCINIHYATEAPYTSQSHVGFRGAAPDVQSTVLKHELEVLAERESRHNDIHEE